MPGTIVQVSLSKGGVPKLPVLEAEVGELGILGDGHNDTANHGGPERALCLFSLERIQAMAAEGHPIAPGSTGENVTIRGVDWNAVVPGARLRLGADLLVEVTRYTTPCKTNAASFQAGDFNRMHQNLFPGFSRVYARVLAGGAIRPGDAVELLPLNVPRPYERRISSEEAREGYIFILKNRLVLFPAVGEDFTLFADGTTLRARVEARHCECRGPAEPHEHYFIRRLGLVRGQRVVLRPVAEGFELITT